MKERLKAIRKFFNLTQSEFGKRIGITNSAIGFLERGDRNITDKVIISICREFRVNEPWLRNGAGSMFKEVDNEILLALANEYGLDDMDIKMVETYMTLPEDRRMAFKDFALRLADAVKANGIEAFIASESQPVNNIYPSDELDSDATSKVDSDYPNVRYTNKKSPSGEGC